jgi:DNA-binding Lrp family transcriptional regulator
MAVKLDDVDIQLLRELQDDADRTNVELARIVGLSPAGTLNRVRRLKETGVSGASPPSSTRPGRASRCRSTCR